MVGLRTISVLATLLSALPASVNPAVVSQSALHVAPIFVSDLRPNANATSDRTRRTKRRPLSREERLAEDQERKERILQQRERARRKLASIRPDISQLEPLSRPEIQKAVEEDHPWVRRTGWRNDGTVASLADPSESYDKWQQAYRMLGGFIDCDHGKSDENHHSGDDYQEESENACSRWMLWAAYVDPNYQGNEYDEYFGDDPVGALDCHDPDTEWELLGVYRQEFYQFIEQISKHLWAIDEYEYVVALAGLSYMTDADCFAVGYDSSGNAIYAGVAPQSEGKFMIALYTDGGYCLTPDDTVGTFDDFGLTSNVRLSSKDNGDGDDDTYSYAQEWWSDTQEYTLTQLNEVYESFTYCTSCVDFPTYQDGYFIGDYGTDDDDLINQCWKFYSHDSYTCESDCIALAHGQGTILGVTYGGLSWGKTPSGFYTATTSGEKVKEEESHFSRMLSTAFVSVSFALFVATFLAFAVARRHHHQERSSGRSRRLLDEQDGEAEPERPRRSKSRSRKEEDGVFRSRSTKTDDNRSKRSSRSKSMSKRRSRKNDDTETYDPPSSRRSSSARNKSRRQVEDF